MACGVEQTSQRKRMGQLRFLFVSVVGLADLASSASFEAASNAD